MKSIITLLSLLIVAIGSTSFAADQDPSLNELQQHGARSRSTWPDLLRKDARERVQPAPDIVIDYLRKDNELNGYRERPRRAEVDPSFMKDIHAAIDELPSMVKRHIEEHVVGVFLVHELGTTGYAELLNNFDENKLGFIVFDVDFLQKKANEWISWRENSPFRREGLYAIAAEIESVQNDSRKAAVQYILLHEVGHLVGVAKGAHPNWFVGGDPKGWPFGGFSWLTHKAVFTGESKYDGFFPTRTEVKYYAFENASLSSKAIREIYEKLSRTDFVSLYAATNMYDDFAETYAMYVHVRLQNRPWVLRVLREGKTVLEIGERILETRVSKKTEYMNGLFKEQNVKP